MSTPSNGMRNVKLFQSTKTISNVSTHPTATNKRKSVITLCSNNWNFFGCSTSIGGPWRKRIGYLLDQQNFEWLWDQLHLHRESLFGGSIFYSTTISLHFNSHNQSHSKNWSNKIFTQQSCFNRETSQMGNDLEWFWYLVCRLKSHQGSGDRWSVRRSTTIR